MAPAKSMKPSMYPRRSSEKSKPFNTFLMSLTLSGKNFPIATNISEAMSAITITPIEPGSLRKRKLRYANNAERTMRIAKVSYRVIQQNLWRSKRLIAFRKIFRLKVAKPRQWLFALTAVGACRIFLRTIFIVSEFTTLNFQS